ncbi:MAG: hypothetical protein WCJ67_11000 [Thermoleophilia bacterium]
MSNVGLFLLGVAVTIPAAAGIAALIFAATADLLVPPILALGLFALQTGNGGFQISGDRNE